MAKGFSFVLVTVVMVMMLVFGLLSLSSAGADLRLSQKATTAQQVYYELDTQGEQLTAACGGASAGAWSDAGCFISQRRYEQALPADFYECLRPLAAKAKVASSAEALAKLKSGVFYYFLEKQLKAMTFDAGFTCLVNQELLQNALGGHGSGHLATVNSTVKSSLDPKTTLSITLACDFTGSGVPAFEATRWQTSVSGLEISSDSSIKVWNGL
ncbi:MAG: hypothetical protein P4M02_10625 [Clostridia bacterium]|nr:hypothetical protein [Clostridia bacterium]